MEAAEAQTQTQATAAAAVAAHPARKDVYPEPWRYPTPEYKTVCNDCSTCCWNVMCCPVLLYFTGAFCAEACFTCKCSQCGCYLARFYHRLYRDTETGPVIRESKLEGNCYNVCYPRTNFDMP